MTSKQSAIKNSILSLITGDMIGTPVQFKSRRNLEEALKNYSIKDVIEGVNNKNLPLGVWSDDSSMTLCTIKSIIDRNSININDISENFVKWFKDGYLTPLNKSFDVGQTTFAAISNIMYYGQTPTGLSNKRNNGNGSLMRILPVSLYCYFKNLSNKETFEVIKNVSSITHAHPISIIACYIYTKVVFDILNNKNKDEIFNNLKNISFDDSISNEDKIWLQEFQNIISGEIKDKNNSELNSTGYVIYTLEVALWGFFNTNNVEDCIFEICKLGYDTDTNAAVGGSLSGLYYGLRNNNLDEYWINKIIKKDMILELIDLFMKNILNN